MYKDDSLTFEDVGQLMQRFSNQTLDFFGAIRASTYDDQILCATPLYCAAPTAYALPRLAPVSCVVTRHRPSKQSNLSLQ